MIERWHCYHCGDDQPPTAFYCTQRPLLDAPAWWCKTCVHKYVNGTKRPKAAA